MIKKTKQQTWRLNKPKLEKKMGFHCWKSSQKSNHIPFSTMNIDPENKHFWVESLGQ
jgi:hypothetical protein